MNTEREPSRKEIERLKKDSERAYRKSQNGQSLYPVGIEMFDVAIRNRPMSRAECDILAHGVRYLLNHRID